jgi:hypothetical protein
MYKPLLYSGGYWLMVDSGDNLRWIMIAPDGDTVSAIAQSVEGTRLRHSHIHILPPSQVSIYYSNDRCDKVEI